MEQWMNSVSRLEETEILQRFLYDRDEPRVVQIKNKQILSKALPRTM